MNTNANRNHNASLLPHWGLLTHSSTRSCSLNTLLSKYPRPTCTPPGYQMKRYGITMYRTQVDTVKRNATL